MGRYLSVYPGRFFQVVLVPTISELDSCKDLVEWYGKCQNPCDAECQIHTRGEALGCWNKFYAADSSQMQLHFFQFPKGRQVKEEIV